QGYPPPPPPPHQQYSPMPTPGPAVPKGLAMTSLITGIIGLLLGWVPIVGLVIGAVAVVTGIVALRKTQPKGMSITGIVTGGLAMLLSIILAVTVGFIVSATEDGERAPETQATSSPTATTADEDRKSTRLNSSHVSISYAVFCLKKKKELKTHSKTRDPT